MNRQRILVLAGAFVASIVVAFLVSHMLGGGTEKAKAVPPPPKIAMSEVLVASSDLAPGTQLNPSLVHWQAWPKSTVDASFITREANPNLDDIVTGAVVRAPLVSGEPLTTTKVVEHAQGAGFMAAIVGPGMRALSIPISTDTGAGGFILPNDHVDVIATILVSENPRRFGSVIVLNNVRVLAVDQTYESKDQKTVLAKTATLEVTPVQGQLVARAAAAGQLSLALRGLSDDAESAADKTPALQTNQEVNVIRFGVERPVSIGGGN